MYAAIKIHQMHVTKERS